MNVKSKENVENSAVELVIEVGAQEFEAALDKVYKKQRGSIAVPGFRKGKAPRKIIEGMYGSGVFYEDAIEELYPSAYAEAVEQEKLDVVAYPKVEVLEVGKDGFTFKAVVTVRPEAKIGTYKGLSAEKEAVAVTDEDIENELKPYVERATRLVNVEREAKMGDTVLLDFEGFDNGVPFEGGKAENHALELGSHSFVPGFEEGVVGLKPGDEKDIDVTFPEDYHADLAGKPVVFKIKVHEVKEPQAPVVDDEFAKDVSEFDTLDEFKKDLGDKLKERRQTQADRAYEDALMDQVVEALEVELPDAMVDYRAEQMVQDYAQRITSQGIPFEKYLEMTGQTMDRMKEQAKESAIKQIKYEMAMDAVAAAEGIVISDEELDAEYQSLADQYKMELDQVKALASAEDVRTTLLRRKAIDVVKDSAKVGKAKKPAAKKAAKETEDETAEEKPKKKVVKKEEETQEEEEEEEEKPKKKAETEQAPKTEE